LAKIYAVIAAAGKSSRMKGINKQMFMLKGIPVLVRSLNLFEHNDSVDGIILVVPPDNLLEFESEISNWNFKKINKLVSGGINRQQSVYFGLLAVPSDCDIVLIHDAARPLTGEEDIKRLIGAVKDYGAAILAVPAKDTIKEVDANGQVVNTLKRENLWLAQTPQGFNYKALLAAHQDAEEKQLNFTDDSSLLETKGIKVKIITGSYQNIKITTQDDLIAAEVFLGYKD
jgi:2-C-methyl-D-erythritol 4-phosphate cytidylyltransferase